MKKQNITNILLIEDNQGDADLIQEMLLESGSASSYKITHVTRLKDSVKQLQNKEKIDVILSDVKLPDTQGGETLTELQRVADYVPIIFVTGSNEDLAIQAIQGGAQDYLLKSEFDSEVLTRTIRYAIERKKLEKQKDDFLGVASHELKTPITSIKAYTQVLNLRFQKAGDKTSSDLVSKMDAQLNKLNNLIGDLLDVTKIEGGTLQFHEDYFDYNNLVEEIVEEMQRTTDKHTITTQLIKTKRIYGDRDRIGQVLTNLIVNAIKYSPHNKKITVKTTVRGTMLHTCVEDHGVGIPLDMIEKVFERFFRVSGPTQDTYPGLGLGLYITSEIVRRHKGKIWVESEEGNGSCFYFSLPLQNNTD